MIKLETIGMFDVAKNNPVLTSVSATPNYSFITSGGVTYLILQTITGDKAYVDGQSIPAGEKLNGFDVAFWAGQNLIVDEQHIAYGVGETYASITAGTTLFTINGAGKLAIAQNAPASGVYFKAVEKCKLTEKAVKVQIIVVDVSGSAGATTLAGLTDVDTTGATSGQVLKFDGTSWKPAADQTE